MKGLDGKIRKQLAMSNEQLVMNKNMSDNNNKKCVPELRFPGFTGDWVEKKFGECFDTLTNSTLSRADLNYETGKALYVHYGDILIKFGEILNIEQEQLPYITDDILAEKACRSVLRNGDIILADTAEDETAGKTTEVTNIGTIPVVAGLHTIPLRPLFQFANGYLGYYFNSTSYRSGLFRLMQGAKVTSISKTAIKETRILFPPTLAEQEKIAECLSSLDDEIAAETEQVDALKEHKKGMMQQLFPSIRNEELGMRNGKCVPKLRFPGFEGEWVEKKLGEVGKFCNNKCKQSELKRETYISTENILQDFLGVKEATKLPQNGSYTKFCIGDILVSNIRPYLKKVWYANFEGAASNDVLVFRTKELYDSQFLAELIKSDAFVNYCMKGAKGVKMPRGDKGLMLEYGIFLPPTIAEQEKIAECLSSIDEQIAAQQQKVEALKNHKKGLMQKLFPIEKTDGR